MQLEAQEFKNKGMYQDYSISKASNEFAFENHNIRITAVNDNTLLSVTNEKGPKELEFGNNSTSIEGKYLGHCILGDNLIIFAVKGSLSYIYKLKINSVEDTSVGVTLLYNGQIGFSSSHPIETLGYYESEDIQKVYWVDGYNQPRVINIATDEAYPSNEIYQFDFISQIDTFPKVTVSKEYLGYGEFPAGVIQYYLTYYNKFGSETNIVYSTDLNYITQSDRGAKADEKVVCDFKLQITNLDTNFDYIRVYSVKRSSLDGPKEVNIVADVSLEGLSKASTITVIDSNALQETIDETLLYFIGGRDIIAETLDQKDDTLFLGNITLESDVDLESLKAIVKNNQIYRYFRFGTKKVNNPEVSGYWNWDTQVGDSSTTFKTFKKGEVYRFAIQFQTNKGTWLQPIYIGEDIECNISPVVYANYIEVPNLEFDYNSCLPYFSNFPISNYRIVMAETSAATRKIVAQGVLCPTVFNLAQRINNAPYSIGSWIMRPDGGNAHYEHFDDIGSEEDNLYRVTHTSSPGGGNRNIHGRPNSNNENQEPTPEQPQEPADTGDSDNEDGGNTRGVDFEDLTLFSAPLTALASNDVDYGFSIARNCYGPNSYVIATFYINNNAHTPVAISNVTFEEEQNYVEVESIENNTVILRVTNNLRSLPTSETILANAVLADNTEIGFNITVNKNSETVDERTEELLSQYFISSSKRKIYGVGSKVVIYGDYNPQGITPPQGGVWKVQVGGLLNNSTSHSAIISRTRPGRVDLNVFYGGTSNSTTVSFSNDAPVVDETSTRVADVDFVHLNSVRLDTSSPIRLAYGSTKVVRFIYSPANATIKSYAVAVPNVQTNGLVIQENEGYLKIDATNVTVPTTVNYTVWMEGVDEHFSLKVEVNSSNPSYDDDPDVPTPPSPDQPDQPITPPTRVSGVTNADNISQELQGINYRADPTATARVVPIPEDYTAVLFSLIIKSPGSTSGNHSRNPSSIDYKTKCTLEFRETLLKDATQSDTNFTEIDSVIINSDSRESVIAEYNKYIENSGLQSILKFPGEWGSSLGDNPEEEKYAIIKLKSDNFSIIEKLDNNQRFFIDRSIVTLNSPDLENNFETVNNNAGLKLRIVGAIPITSNYSESLIETSTKGVFEGENILQSYNFRFPNLTSDSYSLINDYLYKDYIWKKYTGSVISSTPIPDLSAVGDITGNYKVYLWQRSGPINCQPVKDVYKSYYSDELLTETYSILKHKIFANKRCSAYTDYFTTPIKYEIHPTKIFNSDELTLANIAHQNYITNYYGNYDFLVPPSSKLFGYLPVIENQSRTEVSSAICRRNYNTARIKFKETPHAIISFKEVNGATPILPKLSNDVEGEHTFSLDDVYGNNNQKNKYPWSDDELFYTQKTIRHSMPYFYLLLGELYRDTDEDLYGGKDDNTIQRLSWIPVCKPVSITEGIGVTEGDTYFQRWDCLKSYPYTEEDENSVVDITSFMLETHINLNGRCDVNKDNLKITLARPTNVNLFNPVYNQSNNTFRYNILDDKYDLNTFSNQITWSLTKNPTENIDTWTNITLANILSLDGKNGPINKIINSNDTLVVFQDKAVSVVNYNERMQISTEQGVPVTIANSGKVLGYTVVSDKTGCINKWSICPTSSGVYYIDDFNKALMMYNLEGLNNISANGMSQWFKNNLNSEVWKPEDINRGYRLSYDSVTKDVYITNKVNCLLFNEQLGTFTSFMDYNDIDFIYNNRYGNSFTFTNGNNITKGYKLFGGNYNKGFDGKDIFYSITYKVNPEPLTDKIFTNVDYIADRLSPSKGVDEPNTKVNRNPFNKFEIWNEYQSGECDLTTSYKPSFLKQKFRIWRVDVPRDKNSRNKLDRIRNPWVNIKLFTDEPSNDDKMEFHNMIVKYYK